MKDFLSFLADNSLISAIILAGVTNAIQYALNRQQNKASIKEAEESANAKYLDNVKEAISIWEKTAEKLEEKVEQLKNEIEEQQKKISLLTNQLNRYDKMVCNNMQCAIRS